VIYYFIHSHAATLFNIFTSELEASLQIGAFSVTLIAQIYGKEILS
jgi:hypothetical protein